MSTKQRLSASIDADLIEAARRFVAEGLADNVSAWVNDALRDKVEHDEKLLLLGEAIKGWEAEFGEITDADIEATERWVQENAIHIKGDPEAKKRFEARVRGT